MISHILVIGIAQSKWPEVKSMRKSVCLCVCVFSEDVRCKKRRRWEVTDIKRNAGKREEEEGDGGGSLAQSAVMVHTPGLT